MARKIQFVTRTRAVCPVTCSHLPKSGQCPLQRAHQTPCNTYSETVAVEIPVSVAATQRYIVHYN